MPLRLLFILVFKVTSTLISAQAVTLLNSGDLWSYQEGNPGIFNNWMMQGYDDSVWEVGNGGIGYGDDDDSTLLTDAQSVYMRQEFTLFNLEEITELSLFASFDDGFVAYLNGVEIAKKNEAISKDSLIVKSLSCRVKDEPYLSIIYKPSLALTRSPMLVSSFA